MTPQTQLFQHNPPETYGDCFRTALASLLNMNRDDVPHFFGSEDGDWIDVDKWLSAHGFAHFTIPFAGSLQDVLYTMKTQNPDIYYLISGGSPRGFNHQCIAVNDEIICDPAPDGGGLIGPNSDGYIWVGVLLPASIHKLQK